MKKCRIVKITRPDGAVVFQIQQKHWLFRWKWCNAWQNYIGGLYMNDEFSSLKEALSNLWFFSGRENLQEIVFETP